MPWESLFVDSDHEGFPWQHLYPKENLLKKLIEYRTELMGLSILWIMLYHASILLPDALLPLIAFKNIGYTGVDIFFLLSGIGIAFSLSKSEKLKDYYSKRLKRIMPTFWLALIALAIVEIAIGVLNVKIRLLSFIGLDFLVFGSLDVWFIPAIMTCYILAPFVYKFLLVDGSMRRLLILLSASMFLSILITFTAPHLIIFSTRLPSFLLGLFIGIASYGKRTVPSLEHRPFQFALLAVALAGLWGVHAFVNEGLRWRTGLWWYPSLLLAYPACFLFGILLDHSRDAMLPFHRFLRFTGGLSLELYLVHGLIFHLANLFPPGPYAWNIGRIPEYVFYVALAFILSNYLNKMLGSANFSRFFERSAR